MTMANLDGILYPSPDWAKSNLGFRCENDVVLQCLDNSTV